MGKGYGLSRGGSRLGGGGGGGGALSGDLGPAKQAQAVISKLGGLAKGAEIPFRKEFERGAEGGQQRAGSIAHHTAKFAGAKTTAEKNAIATSGKPISVSVSKVNGRWYAGVSDGRHRLYGAKAAGATRIKAEVTISVPGKADRVVTTKVRV